jgi:quercetin dioxygenase-like cupin family protein
VQIDGVPFAVPDWSQVEPVEHPGASGRAIWRTVEIGNLRVRKVEYSPGYVADHWCVRGHVLLVLEGELETELGDGRRFTLRAGMHYQVADGAEPHRSSTVPGASLFVVD